LGIYKHNKYQKFYINDTKKREIHKAKIKDRFINFVLYENMYLYFEKVFIFDSYSCRINKGVQKAVFRFLYFARKITKNNTKKAFVLKLDIKKCFHNIDQSVLKSILEKYITQKSLLNLLFEIIDSFKTKADKKGIPLGNITSQIFINIYLHELDIFVKKDLKVIYYIRYADDFLILENDLEKLKLNKSKIEVFLNLKLKLEIKNEVKNIFVLSQGVNFLGYKIFPKYITLKSKNKKRFLQKVNYQNFYSYLGFLKHCKSYKLQRKIIGLLEK
jgi:RNA-directed DNA polymerase